MARTYKQLISDYEQANDHHKKHGHLLSRNAREDVDNFLESAMASLACHHIFTEVEDRDDFLSDAYRLISRAWLRYQEQEQFA